MKKKLRYGRGLWLTAALSLVVWIGLLASCQHDRNRKTLTLAINSGVEGDALRQAARDYEQQTGVHLNIAEFPYANLFEKELLDLNSRTADFRVATDSPVWVKMDMTKAHWFDPDSGERVNVT